MPTIVRKSGVALMGARRETLHSISWQVRSSIWSPPTDEYETEEAYIVRVEIAGMREEDFEVAIENHTLYISGSRRDHAGQRAYHQMEIRFGKFAAIVPLPGLVDVETSRAEYRDGFLTVTLPKTRSSYKG